MGRAELGRYLQIIPEPGLIIAPNHGWRHRFSSMARHVDMHVDIHNIIQGDTGDKIASDYGDAWIEAAYREIMSAKNPIKQGARRATGFVGGEPRSGQIAIIPRLEEAPRSR
jgi:hypothetical protein